VLTSDELKRAADFLQASVPLASDIGPRDSLSVARKAR
jgi:hypothetical protein